MVPTERKLNPNRTWRSLYRAAFRRDEPSRCASGLLPSSALVPAPRRVSEALGARLSTLSECLFRIKMRRTQAEHMKSATVH